MEFWAGRVHSGKSFQANRVSNSGDISLNMGNEEGEEVSTPCFTCPFCYIDIDVLVLCTHLQEEHCFGLNNAVCPICAASLGKDPLSHFLIQHVQSVKRRRKHQKPGLWNNDTTTMAGQDLQELTARDGFNGDFNLQEPSYLDSHLFAFLPIVPPFEPASAQKESISCDVANATGSQSKQHRSDPARVENYEEKQKRAMFFQELMASTIFLD